VSNRREETEESDNSIVESGTAIQLSFGDGSRYNVSLVVGADGVFSTVHSLMHRYRHLDLPRTYKGGVEQVKDSLKLKYLGLMVVLGISPVSCSLLPPNSNIDEKVTASGWLGQQQWLDGHTRVFSMPFDANSTMWQLSFPMDEAAALELSTASISSCRTPR